MDIHTNIPLKNYLTMKLGGSARFMTDASSKDELAELWRNAKSQGLRVVVLGGGSNTLARDEGFDGLVVRNRIMEKTVLGDDASSTIIRFGGGEIWDDAVRFAVERNLSGIEAMSAIPGTVGAAPVQNIGAYGQELADTFVELEAYDSQADQFITMSAEDCKFSYRSSTFRTDMMGRYGIVSVTLRLYKTAPQPPFYPALEKYFADQNITIFTPQTIRDAVMAIRFDKLPDPTKRPNSGSFFKNAIVEKWQLDDLIKQYPDLPHFDFGDHLYKVPTGWLIEQTGLKGQVLNGIRVHDRNALVLINESATSFDDLVKTRNEIIGKVRDQFRVQIEQEPLEL